MGVERCLHEQAKLGGCWEQEGSSMPWKTQQWGKESSTAESMLGTPAGMLPKEVWEKHRDVPLLWGNLTPMILVELCHSIQPAATGLVSALVREEGDAAAQWQQIPREHRQGHQQLWSNQSGSNFGRNGNTNLLQSENNLSTAGWHNCPGCCLSRHWGSLACLTSAPETI